LSKHFTNLLTPQPDVLFLGKPTSLGLLSTKPEEFDRFQLCLKLIKSEILKSFQNLIFINKVPPRRRCRPGPRDPLVTPLPMSHLAGVRHKMRPLRVA